uniref:Uncharacterized protein n=1 Tax=Setaria digitata TaxID=48799 RepID=A0A915Q7V5_9BILA
MEVAAVAAAQSVEKTGGGRADGCVKKNVNKSNYYTDGVRLEGAVAGNALPIIEERKRDDSGREKMRERRKKPTAKAKCMAHVGFALHSRVLALLAVALHLKV